MTMYAVLKSDIADFLAREDDPELKVMIPTFIRLCEAKIRRDVRVRAMETSTDLTIDSRTEAVPTGFLETRRLVLDVTGSRALDYLTPERLYASNIFEEQGAPSVYTIEGDNFVFAPEPSSSFTGKLLYFKAFDALSAEIDTNWLLTNAYDVYLYGALVSASEYVKEDPSRWENRYMQAVDRVNYRDQMSKLGASGNRAARTNAV